LEIIDFFSLIILNGLGILGLFITIDFYYENKRNPFKVFSIAWSLYLITGIIPFFINENIEPIIYIILAYSYVASLIMSVLFFTAGFLMYFLDIKIKHFIIIFTLMFIPSLLLIFLYEFNAIFPYFIMLGNIILVSGVLIPLLKYKKFKDKYQGSVKWYYLLASIIIIQIIFSLFLQLTDIDSNQNQVNTFLNIVFNDLLTIIIVVIILILMVHIEYNILHEEKHKLIDKYSHNLGNIMQSLYSACQLINKGNLEKDQQDKLEKLQSEKLKEASKLIKEIRKL